MCNARLEIAFDLVGTGKLLMDVQQGRNMGKFIYLNGRS